jgi:hypothetical protein
MPLPWPLSRRGDAYVGGPIDGQCATVRTLIFKRSGGLWAEAYTRPHFRLTLTTYWGIRCVVSGFQ